ncbi:flavodoxin domain-containing protein [Weissella halotolerans]|uniref:Probabale flavodoxin n=1 Tax=Weissella halotolerans DSM 20190 TaxID=1123500 RepID=A0A0R2FY49_9LACO|nr:flavodoxin domain-containing protein [Weissella halotolerans]KRN32539.1 probabale flavodoxin [Weissella halotolerans DSM 20190]
MVEATVLYATITGNNEALADRIIDQLHLAGLTTVKQALELVDPLTITAVNTPLLVIVPYTFDQGSLPEEALDFYDDLSQVDLGGVVFGVAGSGDDFYGQDFCTAVDAFTTRLLAAGGQQGAPSLKINLNPTASDQPAIEEFTRSLVQALKN